MWFFFLVIAAVVGCTSSSSPSFPHARYDRAITVFAPDGSLLQVEYASAVSDLGAPAVAVIDESARGVVLAASAAARREDGLVEGQKLVMIDEHIYAASAGLRADGRVLFDRARQECQEYRLRYGEPPSVAHISRFIADLQHGFTRTGRVDTCGPSPPLDCVVASLHVLPPLLCTHQVVRDHSGLRVSLPAWTRTARRGFLRPSRPASFPSGMH